MRSRTTFLGSLLACLVMWSAVVAQEGGPNPTPAPPAVTPAPAPPPVVRVTAELADGAKILGQAIELQALPVKTGFGSVQIPLRLLASIESNKDRTAVQCRFKNNDTLTVTLEIDTLRLKTTYGEATIPLSRVNKLHFAEVK
ncbi:MAG: hypothetical protein WD768_16355 [Phycisphaeraceae bacterium]